MDPMSQILEESRRLLKEFEESFYEDCEIPVEQLHDHVRSYFRKYLEAIELAMVGMGATENALRISAISEYEPSMVEALAHLEHCRAEMEILFAKEQA